MAQIKARCIEEGECWIWQGAMSQRLYPMVSYNGKTTPVRRVVCMLDGRPPKKGQPIECACENRQCVRPSHMKATTMVKLGKKTAKAGYLSTKAKCAKVSAAHRSSGRAKLSVEKAQEIRESTETGAKLAIKYGVDESIVNRVRRGLLWKNYAATPFAGLGAR